MIKFYGKLIKIQLKKHILINLFIVLQITAVILAGIVSISAVQSKLELYESVRPMISSDGMLCNGYFTDPDEQDGLFRDTEKLKSEMKNVDLISSINFSSLQTGVDENTGEVKTAYVLIYDEYASNLFTPKIAEGEWITNSSDGEHTKAVVTRNPYGWKVGDIVSAEGVDGEVDLEIIGIIDDNERYLCYNTSAAKNEPTYNNMFSSHFNTLNDELKNRGLSDEEIKQEFESLGYTDEIVYNEPVLFVADSEWAKTGETSIMSDSMYIRYKQGSNDNDRLFNRKYIQENLNVLSSAIRFSDIEQNSIESIEIELLTFMPVLAVVFLIATVGLVCINTINCKNQMHNYAVLDLNGAGKGCFYKVTILYNLILCFAAIVLSACVLLVCNIFGALDDMIIEFGIVQLISIAIVVLLFVLLACICVRVMINRASLFEALADKEM